MIGWRKSTAWMLVYSLVVVSTIKALDIPDNASELLMWITGFFFGANAVKPLMQGVKVNIGQDKK